MKADYMDNNLNDFEWIEPVESFDDSTINNCDALLGLPVRDSQLSKNTVRFRAEYAAHNTSINGYRRDKEVFIIDLSAYEQSDQDMLITHNLINTSLSKHVMQYLTENYLVYTPCIEIPLEYLLGKKDIYDSVQLRYSKIVNDSTYEPYQLQLGINPLFHQQFRQAENKQSNYYQKLLGGIRNFFSNLGLLVCSR